MAGNIAARASWMVALKAAAAGNQREPPKGRWKFLIKKTLISSCSIITFCGVCSTALAFIEGDELAEEGRYFFQNAEFGLSNFYSRWLASVYITTTTVTTVGYGDIVPFSPGGKWFVMVFCTLGFVADIICIIRLAELITACMATLTYKIFQKKQVPCWFNPAVLFSVLVSFAVLNAIFWMQLTRLNAPGSPFQPWTFTDSCWFSWATFTTVGFGDFSPASSGQLGLSLMVANLLITLIGLGLMTSLIESVVEFVTISRARRRAKKQEERTAQKPGEGGEQTAGRWRFRSPIWKVAHPSFIRKLCCLPKSRGLQVLPVKNETLPSGKSESFSVKFASRNATFEDDQGSGIISADGGFHPALEAAKEKSGAVHDAALDLSLQSGSTETVEQPLIVEHHSSSNVPIIPLRGVSAWQ